MQKYTRDNIDGKRSLKAFTGITHTLCLKKMIEKISFKIAYAVYNFSKS